MTARVPTPDQVRGLWSHMTSHFGSRVIDKQNAVEMKIVSGLLGALKIVDQQSFMGHYCTTWGERIYVPFTVGVPLNEWSLFNQVVVCAHEHQHVVQSQELGFLTYATRYLGSTSTRADYEAQAYRASLELNWWHSRTTPDPEKLAHALSGYGVAPVDIEVAATTLRAASESIQRGAILNEASKIAIHWLNANAPELRAGT